MSLQQLIQCMYFCLYICTVGSNYSQYDGTSSGSETAPLKPAPARGAASSKLEHQTLLDIDNPEQNANSFGKPFESSVSTTHTYTHVINAYNTMCFKARCDDPETLHPHFRAR